MHFCTFPIEMTQMYTLHRGGAGVVVEVSEVVGTTSVFVQRKEICFVAV